jgi:hypothetical protein
MRSARKNSIWKNEDGEHVRVMSNVRDWGVRGRELTGGRILMYVFLDEAGELTGKFNVMHEIDFRQDFTWVSGR